MDQYEFWDIIRRFTTTIFCAYTPYNIDTIPYIEPKKERIYKESKITTNIDKNSTPREELHIIEDFI